MPPSYLVAWFILFVINQVHRHIWLFGLSCLLSTNFTVIFGCAQYFQKGWTHQCRYIENNVGLLCCSVLLKVVVASDSGKYQQPTVVDTILVILVNTMLPTNYFSSSVVQVIQLSDLITTNPTCVLDNLLYFGSTLIVEWETNQSTISRLHCHITATLPYHGYFAILRLFCHSKAILPYQSYFAISRLLYHTKATVPPTVKAKPTKNFSSKRKLPYHKTRRSACFSPTFLFV